jgi:hypothetical protein
MKKYFYTNGIDKIGPFTLEELKGKNLSGDTKVWFYGLSSWTFLSEIDELNTVTNSIPPQLKTTAKEDANNINNKLNDFSEEVSQMKKLHGRKDVKAFFILMAISAIIIMIGFIFFNNQKDNKLYLNIVSSSYETDVDFDFYVDKFYRDIGNYGIFPKKPQIKIIKFAKLDQLENATHIHGISYGMKDDDKIEIYINPTTWAKFNKPMRYFLMYHELSHDVLNVDDLENLPINEGKLMYPAIHNYESKNMDDFIESSHKLFQEIADK